MSPREREAIRERYIKAKEQMPEHINAAKRVHLQRTDYDWWWTGYGKDESCQIEGTANHWRWLAMIILGLVDPIEHPYSEDKETPEVVLNLLDELNTLSVANRGQL